MWLRIDEMVYCRMNRYAVVYVLLKKFFQKIKYWYEEDRLS